MAKSTVIQSRAQVVKMVSKTGLAPLVTNALAGVTAKGVTSGGIAMSREDFKRFAESRGLPRFPAGRFELPTRVGVLPGPTGGRIAVPPRRAPKITDKGVVVMAPTANPAKPRASRVTFTRFVVNLWNKRDGGAAMLNKSEGGVADMGLTTGKYIMKFIVPYIGAFIGDTQSDKRVTIDIGAKQVSMVKYRFDKADNILTVQMEIHENIAPLIMVGVGIAGLIGVGILANQFMELLDSFDKIIIDLTEALPKLIFFSLLGFVAFKFGPRLFKKVRKKKAT